MNTTTTVNPILGNAPRIEYSDYANAIKTFAASLCTELYGPLGLYSLGHSHSDSEYDADPRFRDGAGALIPRQQPQAPNIFAANAGHAVVAIYNQEQKRYTDTVNGIAAIKTRVLALIGSTLAGEAGDPTHGTILLTHTDIINYVYDNYGQLNAQDLTMLQQRVKTFDSAQTIMANITQQKKTLSLLQPHGILTSNFDRIQYLAEATSNDPQLTLLIHDYKRLHPALAEQTYDGVTEYIRIQSPNMTATAAGYANAAVSSPQAAMIADMRAEIAALKLAAQQLAGGGRLSKGSKVHIPSTQTHYCFFHGYNYRDKPGHNGDGCTSMSADPTYTAAMKAAKAPATINGIKGSERNK